MRHVSRCLVTLFFCTACSIVGLETTIQVQGTVTAADDGSPIAGATVRVGKFLSDRSIEVQTNNQGDYSLSFTGCSDSLLSISASADGFRLLVYFSSSPAVFRCTGELQTIDFQLKREAA